MTGPSPPGQAGRQAIKPPWRRDITLTGCRAAVPAQVSSRVDALRLAAEGAW